MSKKETVDESTKEIKKATKTAAEKTSKTTKAIADPDKKEQEIASLIRIPDSFKKMVIVKDYIKPWQDENGIQYVGIEDFLLDERYVFR